MDIFSILLPVFGLIAAGFLARKFRLLGEKSASELSKFVIWLALPALLFHIMANTDWQSLWNLPFILSYTLGTFGIFVLVLLIRLRQQQPLANASIDAVSASYSNTGYIGFPLLLLVFGAHSQVATMIATFVVVCLLFALAIFLIESDLHGKVPLGKRLYKASVAVLKNPLVFAPIAGLLFSLGAIKIPAGINSFLELLGAAASPVALVSLGLFLADALSKQNDSNNTLVVAGGLSFLKLVLQPIVVALLAIYVFAMPIEWVMMAILLAALPTGTGPYMLADFYQKDARICAKTIVYSTVLSLFTLTLILHWMPKL